MKYKNAKQILFNIQMTRAIQDGRKTQTRRLCDIDKIYQENPEVHLVDGRMMYSFVCDHDGTRDVEDVTSEFSKYKKGEILWVREPVKVVDFTSVGNHGGSWNDTDYITYEYRSDNTVRLCDLPDRFNGMPKWVTNKTGVPNGCIREMARIFLKITDIRIERLQDISERDIYKEGLETDKEPVSGDIMYGFGINEVEGVVNINEKLAFRDWWNKLCKDGYRWEDNPHVFVYYFEVMQ